jgi:hypothetical protein
MILADRPPDYAAWANSAISLGLYNQRGIGAAGGIRTPDPRITNGYIAASPQ